MRGLNGWWRTRSSPTTPRSPSSAPEPSGPSPVPMSAAGQGLTPSSAAAAGTTPPLPPPPPLPQDGTASPREHAQPSLLALPPTTSPTTSPLTNLITNLITNPITLITIRLPHSPPDPPIPSTPLHQSLPLPRPLPRPGLCQPLRSPTTAGCSRSPCRPFPSSLTPPTTFCLHELIHAEKTNRHTKDVIFCCCLVSWGSPPFFTAYLRIGRNVVHLMYNGERIVEQSKVRRMLRRELTISLSLLL